LRLVDVVAVAVAVVVAPSLAVKGLNDTDECNGTRSTSSSLPPTLLDDAVPFALPLRRRVPVPVPVVDDDVDELVGDCLLPPPVVVVVGFFFFAAAPATLSSSRTCSRPCALIIPIAIKVTQKSNVFGR
jgi:hypothetical protein